MIADINAETGEQIVQSILEEGGDASFQLVDVGDPPSIRSAFGSIDHERPLSVLVNNTAALHLMPHDRLVGEIDLELWNTIHTVNLRGAMLCTQAALQLMVPNHRGSIVNVASIAALAGDLARSAYGAAKAGMLSLTRSTATQYGKIGIRCNAVAPGLILSERAQGNLDEAAQQWYLRHYPSQRLGTPEDVAQAVCFLASDHAGFINGQVLGVDGGFLIHAPTYADAWDKEIRGGFNQ